MERFEEQWGIFSENARQAPPLPIVGLAWFAVSKKCEGGGGCDRQTDRRTDRHIKTFMEPIHRVKQV